MAATRIVMASSSWMRGFLRQCAPYCVNLRQAWKGAPDIAGPAASVDRAAFDTHGDTSWTEIPKGSSLLPYLGVLSFGWPGSANPDSDQFRPVPRTCRYLPGQPWRAVSWHSGFRRGAHARPKTTPVRRAAWRCSSGMAARGAGAAAGDATDHR